MSRCKHQGVQRRLRAAGPTLVPKTTPAWPTSLRAGGPHPKWYTTATQALYQGVGWCMCLALSSASRWCNAKLLQQRSRVADFFAVPGA